MKMNQVLSLIVSALAATIPVAVGAQQPPQRVGDWSVAEVNHTDKLYGHDGFFMYNDPQWEQRPEKVTLPGTEAQVMGPYFPRGEYTTKAAFEASGPKR